MNKKCPTANIKIFMDILLVFNWPVNLQAIILGINLYHIHEEKKCPECWFKFCIELLCIHVHVCPCTIIVHGHYCSIQNTHTCIYSNFDFQSFNSHFVLRLVHAICQGSCCWFIDHSQNIQSSYLASILSGLWKSNVALLIIIHLMVQTTSAAGIFTNKYSVHVRPTLLMMCYLHL